MTKPGFIPLLIVGLSVAGCATSPEREPSTTSVSIMTFNVQNLFDTEDDAGKDDRTYLPLAAKAAVEHIAACREIGVRRWREECLYLDWNEAVLDAKLNAIAATIRQVEGGADLVALQEIENLAILERLRSEYLADLGYRQPVLIEGQDNRGVDVAFLTKLPLAAAPELHALTFDEFPDRQGDTRGILEASFLLPDGSTLTGFTVHFPAPFHPTAMRAAAFSRLAELRQALPADHHAFAAGDFNTTSTEVASTNLFERFVRPYWVIAHEQGCGRCRGTYYYAPDDSWSFLDMILFSPARGGNTTWRIRPDSVRILNDFPRQRTSAGRPARFSADGSKGVSDHWPLGLILETTQKQ